jgi:ATP-binding cassette subfamily C protein
VQAAKRMKIENPAPKDAIRPVKRALRAPFLAILLFSMAVNALMLTGPIYMLQIYDRVLSSRSQETLVTLSILAAFLFLMMGVMDYYRGRVAVRVGAQLQHALDGKVFSAVLTRARRLGNGQTGLQDLESVQRLMGSPVFMALFDLPWTPLFILAIFIFHPWLGWLAVLGGAVLVAIAIINRWRSREGLELAQNTSHRAAMTAQALQIEPDLIRSLGMQGSVFSRWLDQRNTSLSASVGSSDTLGAFTTTSKTLRMFLQSAMLGLGAYLVLQNQLTAGAMIAASILLGRALAPVEQVIGQWAMVHRAREGWRATTELLANEPGDVSGMKLPRPVARLTVYQLSVVPPGDQEPVLRDVGFVVEPGDAVGIIGSSGAGKSSLARTIVGNWQPTAGKVRLGGATLDQYDPDDLGRLIGYLPQQATLFPGTIAENIARMDPNLDPERIVAAAKRAAAHEIILRQPNGYDTPAAGPGARLSGGQMQRIGLARAFYDDPVLLVLDEPNSNLDHEGNEALANAITSMVEAGGAVLVMAHRPAAIKACNKVMVLENGELTAFGPRDDVLRSNVRNFSELNAPKGASGTS